MFKNLFKKDKKENPKNKKCYDDCEILTAKKEELVKVKDSNSTITQLNDTLSKDLRKLNEYTEDLEEKLTTEYMKAGTVAGIDTSKLQEQLSSLKKQVEDVPNNAQFRGTAMYVENGETKTVQMTTKTEALNLIKRAQNNEIQLVTL